MSIRKKPQFPPGIAARSVPAGNAMTATKTASITIQAFKGETVARIAAMRQGTSANVVPELAQRFGISEAALLTALRIPLNTMKSRIIRSDLLAASEQDRLCRAEKVWSRAVEILEDEDAARAWIVQRNRSLGGVSPLSLLDTEVGYELVLNTLGHIEYGVVS